MKNFTVGFAHVAYELGRQFAARCPNHPFFEVRTVEELEERIHEADVLVLSSLWNNDLLKKASRLRFVQVVSSGIEQFDLALLSERNIRLANGQGVNAPSVAEHAIGLLLSLTRQLHLARDRQSQRQWRPLIGDPAQREDEIRGKTMAIVGTGKIGVQLAMIARDGFGMRVLGIRREAYPAEGFAEVFGVDRLHDTLAVADVVVICCPLTPHTFRMIDLKALRAMRPDAILINVARGAVIDEAALLRVLDEGRLAGLGLDCFEDEPLPPSSPLWDIPRVIVTPHSAGETRFYEQRIIDVLLDNLARIDAGKTTLRNEIV